MRTLLCLVLLLLPPLVRAESPKSVAVLPLRAKNKASKEVSSVLDDLVLAAVQTGTKGLRVVAQSDVDAALGLEKMKDASGCDAVSCAAEIAGALGVDSIIYGNFSRLGKKYVLSLAWIDQKKGESLGRISESIGESEDAFEAGVRSVVAKLVGAPAISASPPTDVPRAAPEAVNVNDFSAWEILDGTWYAKDGAIYGCGGSLVLKADLDAYTFSVKTELVAGPADNVVAVGDRFHVFQGGLKRYRGSTSDVEGYGLNMIFGAGTLNVFRGVQGSWYRQNPAWNTWTKHASVQPKVNTVVWESVNASHKVTNNGEVVYEFVDGTHPRGAPFFWVESPQALVRFSDMTLKRR